MTINRRSFLRGGAFGMGAVAATTALGRWTRTADAASATRYAGHRSVVAVFLLGGNDGNQLLVPRDSRHALYAAARPTIGLTKAELLPIPIGTQTDATASYGLHPKLQKTQLAFKAGTAALVANVGPAALPTLKTDYTNTAHPRPTNLFSHSDQQDAWSTAVPIPSLVAAAVARAGWGGRLADLLEGLNPPVASPPVTYPAMTLVGGRRTFAAGAGLPLVTSASGELTFNPANTNGFYQLRRDGMADVAGVTNGVELQQGYGDVLATAAAIAVERTRARTDAWAALASTTRTAIDAAFAAASPTWSLPTQLRTVLLDVIAGAVAVANGGLGQRRQVFSVGLGGFDTHNDQRAAQDALFEQLDFALDAYARAVAALATDPVFAGAPPQSTLFTMSDFARTFTENSDGGTDHAWGNHALVLGDRVAGGKIYGGFPNLDVLAADATSSTTDSRGRWIPSTTVEQYVYSMASWLGVNAAEAAVIFPNHEAYRAAAAARGLGTLYTRLQHPLMLADA
ncbi:MAG: DUF1501 domain-containing protein [Kofleriaceae bacterium]